MADEIQKLHELHRSGVLSEEEFAKAKASLLEGSKASSSFPIIEHRLATSHEATLGRAANRFVTFQIVMAVLGLILFLILCVVMFLPSTQDFLAE